MKNPLTKASKTRSASSAASRKELVLDEPDVAHSIYEVPLALSEQKIDEKICQLLDLPNPPGDLSAWKDVLYRLLNPKGKVIVGIVGKYLQHHDAYKSVFEALHHGALAHQVELEIRCFEADKILENGSVEHAIAGCDGYLVPGGFGERGWMGKIMTAKYCRENKIPYFGLCLGMQVMTVEFARHVAGFDDANSTEMDPNTPHPVISLLSEQKSVIDLGGTMRLGSFPCIIERGSKAEKAYHSHRIEERHRHRYEFNNMFKDALEKKGLVISGMLQSHPLCEIVEVKNHPWMVGVQFHPEFKSKPHDPHPLFRDFVGAMIEYKKRHG